MNRKMIYPCGLLDPTDTEALTPHGHQAVVNLPVSMAVVS